MTVEQYSCVDLVIPLHCAGSQKIPHRRIAGVEYRLRSASWSKFVREQPGLENMTKLRVPHVHGNEEGYIVVSNGTINGENINVPGLDDDMRPDEAAGIIEEFNLVKPVARIMEETGVADPVEALRILDALLEEQPDTIHIELLRQRCPKCTAIAVMPVSPSKRFFRLLQEFVTARKPHTVTQEVMQRHNGERVTVHTVRCDESFSFRYFNDQISLLKKLEEQE